MTSEYWPSQRIYSSDSRRRKYFVFRVSYVTTQGAAGVYCACGSLFLPRVTLEIQEEQQEQEEEENEGN